MAKKMNRPLIERNTEVMENVETDLNIVENVEDEGIVETPKLKPKPMSNARKQLEDVLNKNKEAKVGKLFSYY